MDNDFNNILNIFKRLDESHSAVTEKSTSEKQARTMAAAAHDPAFAKKVGIKTGVAREFNKADTGTQQLSRAMKHKNKEVEEGTMADAKHHASGARFGGYWKGTNKGTPRPGQGVGGCAESIEEEISREYSQYLKEYGMTSGGTVNPAGGTNPTDQAKQQKDLQQTQQNLTKLKAAGVTLPTGTGQAAKSTMTTISNPNANPATGAGMDQNAKKLAGSLGQEMEKLLATGNPSQVQQVANAIKQSKLGVK
jgi:hypothetical protein